MLSNPVESIDFADNHCGWSESGLIAGEMKLDLNSQTDNSPHFHYYRSTDHKRGLNMLDYIVVDNTADYVHSLIEIRPKI